MIDTRSENDHGAPPPMRLEASREVKLIALAIAQLHGLTRTIQALRESRHERAMVDLASREIAGKEAE